jgi:hypothetical protein
MATPEPHPYRQLNYPVNNLEQNFDQTKKIQVRANIGIPTSVNKAGQVLTVGNSTGELEWQEPQGGDVTDVKVNNVSVVDNNGVANVTVPSYSEGNMIDISAHGVIGVETTAGITDIQMVNALPANPVATVLYLIPAT